MKDPNKELGKINKIFITLYPPTSGNQGKHIYKDYQTEQYVASLWNNKADVKQSGKTKSEAVLFLKEKLIKQLNDQIKIQNKALKDLAKIK